MFNQRMPRLVEADNESQVSSTAASTVGSSTRSSMLSGQKFVGPVVNRSFVSQPFTGRITLDVIENFLNPISNRSDVMLESQSGLMSLSTATGGYGLRHEYQHVEDDEKRLEKARQQREEAERSYRSMKKEFERELMRKAMEDMNLDENNVNYSNLLIFFRSNLI